MIDYFKNRLNQLLDVGKITHDPIGFSLQYTLLVEEYIRNSSLDIDTFAVAAYGSFGRRELSPYSDIDLMIIVENSDSEEAISHFIRKIWDSGLEISHIVRSCSDIQSFLTDDLQAFTQLFETRLISGSYTIYNNWINEVFNILSLISDDETKENFIKKSRIIGDFIEDLELRQKKYGNKVKAIEPNVKLSPGGLRDFQVLEWLYTLNEKEVIDNQYEQTSSRIFIKKLIEKKYLSANQGEILLQSYYFILKIRHILHIINNSKKDRLEFEDQKKIADLIYGPLPDNYRDLMRDYYNASIIISRFNITFIKRIKNAYIYSLPDLFKVIIDDDFYLKGNILFLNQTSEPNQSLSISQIMRCFYYRGFYSAIFNEKLRMAIVESISEKVIDYDNQSSVFFREIFRLPRNVGITLQAMNELDVLGKYIPEFGEIVGFIQHGVYHYYAADEHTLLAICNLESLADDITDLGGIYNSVEDKESLFLGCLLHDIAKSITIQGHEIVGAEVTSSLLQRLGYHHNKIDKVVFLVKNHLIMEQVAFRRNLNDPDTLQSFVNKVETLEKLNLLYLLTYADLSAVNPALMTNWKKDLLLELYEKAKKIISKNINAFDFLYNENQSSVNSISNDFNLFSKEDIDEHIDLLNDPNYISQFSQDEIIAHIKDINTNRLINVSIKDIENFTNITVITLDSPNLLSKLCGVIAINDLNIHDAKIFTRKDKVIIDNFNVTDFRTHQKVATSKYDQIIESFNLVISGMVQLSAEIKKMKTKWWRIEKKFFKRISQIDIKFEETDNYTIIDIFSPDRLGFLYQVTKKMHELGLNIYFAKISTKGDDIVDSFYVLDRDNKKVSKNYYKFIELEITDAIKQIL